MFCSKCGTELPDIAKFCAKCGMATQRLDASRQDTTPTSPLQQVASSAPVPPTVSSAPNTGSKTFNEKMSEGIDATGQFTFSQVFDAVYSVAETMGPKMVSICSAEMEEGLIFLGFFKSGAQKIIHASLLDIAGKPDLLAEVFVDEANGRIAVDILEATTSRLTYMYIPVSQKAVHGITTYRGFLGYFETELRRIFPEAVVYRR